MRALEGIRVLDLSRVVSGPYCTMVLGDLGAQVLKVEPPNGDETRLWGPPFAGGESAYFLSVNRNKRSICVDLKAPGGAALLQDLAMHCDVLVENFRPGALTDFGLDYASVHARSPGLIYCSITGFGQKGPRSQRPGYDLVIQAAAGLMSINGEPEGQPMKVGVAISDILAGLFAVTAILAALYSRSSTREGQHLDISLFDAQLAGLANVAQSYLLSGQAPRRWGNAHATIVPYQSFRARDAQFVLAVGNDRQFQRLCSLLAHPEWGDDSRFITNAQRVVNQAALIPLLQAAFETRPAAQWLGLLESASIPCGPINTVEQAFAELEVAARDLVVSMAHPAAGNLPMVASPLRLSETAVAYHHPPPRLAEHTDQILAELSGMTPGQIAVLRAQGVII